MSPLGIGDDVELAPRVEAAIFRKASDKRDDDDEDKDD